jgi:peptide/nickel transport system ATP-binding protein
MATLQRRLWDHGSVRFGVAVLAFMVTVALLAPWLGTVDPAAMDANHINKAAGLAGDFALPDGQVLAHTFWLGTDNFGRDIYSRVLYGSRISLVVGIATAILALGLGGLCGMLAGYFRGVDMLLMRFMDGLMAIPAVLLAIALVAALGANVATVVIAIAIPEVPRVTRLVRSLVLTLREEPYVEAARALGHAHVGDFVAAHPAQRHGTLVGARHVCRGLRRADRGDFEFLRVGLAPRCAHLGQHHGRGAGAVQPAAGQCAVSRLVLGAHGIGHQPLGGRLARCAGPQICQAGGLMTQPVLQVDHLSVALPKGADRPMALQNISLQLRAGETLCVVGESGSGKSVLATTVMGLLDGELTVASGSVRLQGESLLDASQARLRGLRGRAMGMVFQEPMTALNPVMRCGEQIDELLRTHTDWPASQRRSAVLDMLAQVRLPDPERMWNSYPHQLSGGQRQRIVIAMAMVMKPALLICDEPTTALDVTTQKDILQLIQTLQQETGSAVLFITHDMGVVADIADQVLVMHRGEAVELGSRAQVLTTPQAPYTQALLAAVPSMTPPPARSIADTPPLLSALKVGKTYDTNRALHDASVALRAGETVGVVGESGSGKSTFARCLLRLIDPSGGEIFWGEDEIATLPEARLRPLRHRVQVVFQDPNRSLNPRMTVGESLVEGRA